MVKKSKIIVGLGNPGKEYQNTRHNIGFAVLDDINKQFGGEFELDKKLGAETSEIKMDGNKVLLVKPQTFVNNSGKSIKVLSSRSKVLGSNLVVIHDDLDVPFGKVKLSFGRSSAGHRGVESIIRALKTDKFFRVRFGTFDAKLAKIRKIKGKSKRIKEMNDFVIGPFTPAEKSKLNRLIKVAAEKALQ